MIAPWIMPWEDKAASQSTVNRTHVWLWLEINNRTPSRKIGYEHIYETILLV